MKRIGSWTLTALVAIWGLIAFLASNSPSDVQQRAEGWLALPILRELPTKLVDFAANPSVLALSFLSIGLAIGWQTKGWWAGRESYPWWDTLGVQMSLLASQIENSNWTSDIHRLNAEIDVVRVATTRRGFPFPKFADGFENVQSILPYLTRVSAHLNAGDITSARSAAQHFSAKPTI